ncbi:MAG: hypothetical protein Q4C53_03535 [Clostridia bacterium]|nr:hypothetical protein [Clostridia bacterium]
MTKRKFPFFPLAFLAVVFLLFVFLHDLFGGTFLASSAYNSYTLQANAWLNGRLDIGMDIPWLELAVYGGRYYVSFPPVPTLIVLPFAVAFGEATPDHLIIALLCLVMLAETYGILRKAGCTERQSVFWSAFFILGSNLLWMCTEGGVWFLAQTANLCFCLAAIRFAQSDRRTLALAMVALAVGCRPFSVFLFLPLVTLFLLRDKTAGTLSAKGVFLRLVLPLIPAALIALAYMALNFARFRNPFEFGHNYLPEFSGAAQFAFRYIPENLKNLLRPVRFGDFMRLDYPLYDGFLLFLANPFFVLLFTRCRKPGVSGWTALCAMLLNFVCLLMHRTFGGWQFGARYLVDLFPCLLLLLLPSFKEKSPRNWELVLAAFAVVFNLYGALAMHFLYA